MGTAVLVQQTALAFVRLSALLRILLEFLLPVFYYYGFCNCMGCYLVFVIILHLCVGYR